MTMCYNADMHATSTRRLPSLFTDFVTIRSLLQLFSSWIREKHYSYEFNDRFRFGIIITWRRWTDADGLILSLAIFSSPLNRGEGGRWGASGSSAFCALRLEFTGSEIVTGAEEDGLRSGWRPLDMAKPIRWCRFCVLWLLAAEQRQDLANA